MARTDYDDLAAFLSDDALTLPPVKSRAFPEGKVYRVPSPDAETGLWLSAVANLGVAASMSQDGGASLSEAQMAELQLDDEDERNFHQRVLGSVYDEMIADGVSWVILKRLSSYAFAYYGIGPEVANDAMKAGAFGGPKAPARPEDKKQPAKRSKSPGAQKGRPGSAGSRKTPPKAGETPA